MKEAVTLAAVAQTDGTWTAEAGSAVGMSSIGDSTVMTETGQASIGTMAAP